MCKSHTDSLGMSVSCRVLSLSFVKNSLSRVPKIKKPSALNAEHSTPIFVVLLIFFPGHGQSHLDLLAELLRSE